MPSSCFRTAQDTTRGTDAIAARKTERSARPRCEAATRDHPDQRGALTERRAKTADSRGHGPGGPTEEVPERRVVDRRDGGERNENKSGAVD